VDKNKCKINVVIKLRRKILH